MLVAGQHDPWSGPARAVWGKTGKDGDGWLPLVQHLEDAAGVAGLLWDTWLPTVVRRRLAEAMGSEEDARALTVFLAGVHDVGKATPGFAQLAHDVGRSELVSAMERSGLSSATLPRAQRVRHTLAGHVALRDWFESRHGWPRPRADALASIVSSHHGIPARDEPTVRSAAGNRASLGDDAWAAVRVEILDRMAVVAGADGVLGRVGEVKLRLPSLVDLVAIVVLADWIASDSDRFPHHGLPTPDRPHPSSDDRVALAAETLDLRVPWQPRELGDPGHAFAVAFPHLRDARPTALQAAALGAARAAGRGTLLVIEAPTGSGKSEAALLAAEALAARSGAGGIFVALPTMATTNAMFGRILRWVDAWAEGDPAVWLAHGKAGLNDDFTGLVRGGRVSGIHDADGDGHDRPTARSSTRVSSWLSGRRKGLLANVVVGTIDQVLLGALQARHLPLRHLALSSKVVIVDEVHATDVYMRSYLEQMLRYLGAYGAPVVLLSATLPAAQRDQLVEAYRAGRSAVRGSVTVGQTARTAVPSQRASVPTTPDAYPVLTVAGETTTQIAVEQDQPSRAVEVRPVNDDLGALVEALVEATAAGGCVGIIRNTVSRAQETFDALVNVFGADVELFHSRFVAVDRAARERGLVDRLGPAGPRPRRAIVVGTQVLEQSLDLDLDLLITDLAPADLLVQRCGRLHRHPRPADDRPVGLRSPQCWVAGVDDWDADIPRAVPGSNRVYDEALLLRAAAVLQPHLAGSPLRLPDDVPLLVAQAFDPSAVAPAGWETAWATAEQASRERAVSAQARARAFQVDPPTQKVALTGWVTTPATEDRDEARARAQVRDSQDGIEVIVVCRDPSGALRLPPGSFQGAGQLIPTAPEDHDPLTRVLAGCTVPLPLALTHPGAWEGTVEQLEASSVADTWQGSRWLAGQLVLALHDPGDGRPAHAVLNGRTVTYDATRGLTLTREAEA